MYNKTHLLLEIIWLITGTLCVVAAIRLVSLNGYTGRILLFLGMAVVSFLFAWFRHRQRKKK